MIRSATFQRHMSCKSHKASAHSVRWHLVIESFCSWARWPYCSCMLNSLFSDASIVVLWGAKGDVASFLFSNEHASVAWSWSFTTASQLIVFHMEPISARACRFIFEDQPSDAFEFQFYKVVPPSVINNSSFYLSLECSLDWCKSSNLISLQGRIRMAKPHDNTPHPSLVLPSCSVPFVFLHYSLQVFLLTNLPLVKNITRKTRECYFVCSQTANISAIPLIFLRCWGCHSLSHYKQEKGWWRGMKCRHLLI